MSAVEIEDVLSSIRRLVAEDLRPLRRPPPRERVNSRLVLTPAHRVATAILHSVPAPEADVVPEPLVQMAPEPPAPARIEFLRAVVPVADEAEADEESDVTRIERTVFQSRSSAARFSLPGAPVPPPAPEQSLVAPESAEPAPTFEAVPEPEPEAVPEPELDAATGAIAAAVPHLEPLILEPHAARAADPLEPALSAEDEVRWIDQAEAEVIAALSAEIEQEVVSRAADDAGAETETSLFAEEPRIDEAVLRDLVRDLIREELQGSLGERITRNVRKLVRAEIVRALSLRDLD